VREENLHNLEEGYYDNLPAEVYTKGFLTAYAEYLGLNPDRLVRMYSKEAGIKTHLDESQKQESPSRVKKIRPPLFTPRLLKIVAIVVIVVIAVSYLTWQFSNFSRNPELTINEPANDITIEQDRVVFQGQAERESELTINGQSVFINEDGTFTEEIALQEGINTIAVVVRDRQGRESSLTRQILVEMPPPPPEEDQLEGATEEVPGSSSQES